MTDFFYTSVFASPPEIERWETNEEPVVILLGWVGCKDRYLEKYSALYASLGCTTVRCITPWDRFFLTPTKNLAPIAVEIEEMIEELDLGRNPIFVHLFSSGGCMVYNSWRRLMMSDNPTNCATGAILPCLSDKLSSNSELDATAKIPTAESESPTAPLISNSSPKLFSNSLNFQGLIFDSGPARTSSWSNALLLTQLHQTSAQPLRQYWMLAYLHTAVIAAVFSFGEFIKLIKYKFEKLILGWSSRPPSMLFQDVLLADPLKLPCAVLYSSTDEICSSATVEFFIDQQKRRGVDVWTKKFVDSPHCQHYRHYPEAYKQLVEDFILAHVKGKGLKLAEEENIED